MLELARKVCQGLSSIRHKDDRKIVVKSNFMDVMVYKQKPEDFGGQTVSEESTSVFIPNSAESMLPKTNDSLSLQVNKVVVN